MRWQLALVLGTTCLAACGRIGEEHVDSAAASIAQAGDSMTVTTDTVAGLAVDTASIPLVVAETNSVSVTSDSIHAASTAELEELRVSMIVPVQGVRAEDLHDTYSEPRSGHTHEALDILAARGTPVLSATDGRLLKLHQSNAGGLMVYAADATDRFILMYGHLDRYADALVEGAPLRRGQVIGYVGTTGNAPAGTPHLHFAIARGTPRVAWWKGEPVNPFLLLK